VQAIARRPRLAKTAGRQRYYFVLFEDLNGVRIETNFLPGKGQLADAGKACNSQSRFA